MPSPASSNKRAWRYLATLALENDTVTEKKQLTEAETRQALAAVRSPKLDELRTALPKTRTSELLGLLMNAEALVERLDEDGENDPKSGPPTFKYTRQQDELRAVAAMLAITDEIDRRIPVP